MNDKNRKERIDFLNKEIEENSEFSSFILNQYVKELRQEKDQLQNECHHHYINNTCDICGHHLDLIFYTTHCPQCSVLEKKLHDKNLAFVTCDDADLMIQLGFMSAPILSVNGEIYNFSQALKWLEDIHAN